MVIRIDDDVRTLDGLSACCDRCARGGCTGLAGLGGADIFDRARAPVARLCALGVLHEDDAALFEAYAASGDVAALGSWLSKIVGKVKKAVQKVAPIAAPFAAAIPVVGGPLSALLGAVGGSQSEQQAPAASLQVPIDQSNPLGMAAQFAAALLNQLLRPGMGPLLAPPGTSGTWSPPITSPIIVQTPPPPPPPPPAPATDLRTLGPLLLAGAALLLVVVGGRR